MATITPRLDKVEENQILNSAFDFWQRGTSFTTSGVYTADRWKQLFSGYTQTTSQSTDVPTQAQSGYQSRYSLLITNGTGASPTAGQYQQLIYNMEGQDYQRLHGNKIRYQFWTKSSVAGTFPIAFQNASANRSYVTTYTVTSANTWQKIAVDLTLDTLGTWAFDNTLGLSVIFTPTCGSTFQTGTLNAWQTGNFLGTTGQTQWGSTTGATMQFAQVMLIGQDFTLGGSSTVDVPFKRAGRSIGHELQMCQRYYEKSCDPAVTLGVATGPQGYDSPSSIITSNSIPAIIRYAVTKRVTATVTTYNPNTFATGSWLGQSSSGTTSSIATVLGQSGLSAALIYVASTTTIRLIGDWSADAEL